MEDDAARERKGEERQKRSDEKRQKETKIKEATKSAEDVDETGKKKQTKNKNETSFFLVGRSPFHQRKWTVRGRSAPSLTRGLWNSRPGRECTMAQQCSQ